MPTEIIVALFGLIGVLVGSFLSLAGNYFLEYYKDKRLIRSTLIDYNIEFTKNLSKISNTITFFNAYLRENISHLNNSQVDELLDYVYKNITQCNDMWPNFKIFLYKYLPSIMLQN